MLTAALHRALGIELDAPGTAFRNLPFELDPAWRNENTVGAPLHIALVAFSLAALVMGYRRRASRAHLLWAASGVAAFLLFSLVLRWQPTQSRLMLPLTLLWAPLVGVVLGSFGRSAPVTAVFFALLAGSVPQVLANEFRPLVGKSSIFVTERADEYYNSRPRERAQALAVIDRLRQSSCRNLGLATSENSFEYPLWALLAVPSGDWRFEHVNVLNETGRRETDFKPCALLRLRGGTGRNQLRFVGRKGARKD